jgi:hypothetical protein
MNDNAAMLSGPSSADITNIGGCAHTGDGLGCKCQGLQILYNTQHI